LNTNIYSNLETCGGQSYKPIFKCCFFWSTTVLIRHLWQLKTVVFLHWCLIHAIILIWSVQTLKLCFLGKERIRNMLLKVLKYRYLWHWLFQLLPLPSLKLQNFEPFQRDRNVVVNFQKHRKRNQKLPIYIKVERNLSNISLI
jgi:hypothetical protein